MPMMTLSPAIAHAAGTDAGNAAMRKGGRTKWSDEDYETAVRTTNRLMLYIPFEQGGLRGLPRRMLLNHVSAADIKECCP